MHFGAWSLTLALGALNGACLAALLLRGAGRHRGSALLAALTLGISLRLLPYILGFAGAYDLHPWLTFAPFDTTLAWGPLLWGWVHMLSTGRTPTRWRWHLLPVAAQLAYQLVAFALPTQAKWDWYTGKHLHVVEPVGTVLVLGSLAAFGLLAWRQYDTWQAWLDANVSNREESRLGWLRALLVTFGATAALGAALTLWHLLLVPLDYFARLPVVAALPLLAYVLALLGYRFGAQAIAMDPTNGAPATNAPAVATAGGQHAEAEPPEAKPPEATRATGKDYRAEAAAWRTRVVAEGWHRDPQLTATTLARLLGASPRSLSRTLNEGLGESFNDFVNRLRVEEAVARLARPGAPDVLRVAFEVGFASKASFNRAFRRHAGTTPTAIRDGGAPATPSQLPPMPEQGG